MESIRVTGTDKGFVIVLRNGTPILEMPWAVAQEISRVILAVAKHVENETANPLKTIDDQALLMRAGAPLGLTDDPRKLKEAFKEAQWNTTLRKAMPNATGIESCEKMGTPRIVMHDPKKVS